MARRGGMPLYKRTANKLLTAVENKALGTEFTEMHTGYRAYSRQVLMTVPFLRNSLDFVFDSELLFQAIHHRFRIMEVPTQSWYTDDASSISPKDATLYALKTLRSLAILKLHQSGIRRSPLFMQ
jgi:hypothetical protein